MHVKKLFLCVIPLLLSDMAIGQAGTTTLFRSYGRNCAYTYTYCDDHGSDFIFLDDGSYVIAGTIVFPRSVQGPGPAPWEFMYLMRVNRYGDPLWSIALGDSTYPGDKPTTWNAGARAIIRTADNNMVVCGYMDNDSTKRDVILMKLDTSGNILWTTTYGGAGDDDVAGIAEDADRSLVMTGYTTSNDSGNLNMMILKADTNGAFLWGKQYGSQENNYDENGRSVKVLSDGTYVIAGVIRRAAVKEDILVIRLKQNGDTLWSRIYGAGESDMAYGIDLAGSDAFVLAGLVSDPVSFYSYMYYIKADYYGDTLWTKAYYNNGSYVSAMDVNDNGEIISACNSSAGLQYGILAKLDSTGIPVFAKAISGRIAGVREAVEGKIAMIGSSTNLSYSTIQNDIILIVADSVGEGVCELTDTSMIPVSIPITQSGSSIQIQDFVNLAANKLFTKDFPDTNKNVCSVGLDDENHTDENRIIRIFPNPSTSPIITLAFGAIVDLQNSHLEVFSVSGNLVAQYKMDTMTSPASLTLPVLSPGIYIIRIISPEGIATARLVIQP